MISIILHYLMILSIILTFLFIEYFSSLISLIYHLYPSICSITILHVSLISIAIRLALFCIFVIMIGYREFSLIISASSLFFYSRCPAMCLVELCFIVVSLLFFSSFSHFIVHFFFILLFKCICWWFIVIFAMFSIFDDIHSKYHLTFWQ